MVICYSDKTIGYINAGTCYKTNIINNNKIKIEELKTSERHAKEWYINS